MIVTRIILQESFKNCFEEKVISSATVLQWMPENQIKIQKPLCDA